MFSGGKSFELKIGVVKDKTSNRFENECFVLIGESSHTKKIFSDPWGVQNRIDRLYFPDEKWSATSPIPATSWLWPPADLTWAPLVERIEVKTDSSPDTW